MKKTSRQNRDYLLRMSDLFEAIKAGDAARVSSLVDSDRGLLQATVDDVSPVLMALYHGKRDIAQLLVERGAPLGFAEACAYGDVEKVRVMLESDRSLLDRRSPDGYPPLGLAIFFGQSAIARFLIESGADVNAAAVNVNNVAPVHAAAAVRDIETMRMLLERGADPNARQQRDYTPLHGAASRGDIAMGTLLLAHGADVNARGTDGMTAADVAAKYGHPEFAAWLGSKAEC
jgi:uncharacterized protein